MKRFLKGLAILTSFTVVILCGIYYAYSKTQGGGEDLARLTEFSRVFLFRHGFIKSLNDQEVFNLYQQKCFRQCHGQSVMITVVLPPAGWMQIVERMRVQEGLQMNGREAEAIIRYLERKFPATRSSVPYKIRRKINRLLWKNDVGFGDVYLDVIYGTPVYFDSINAKNLAMDYKADSSIVFIVSLTVHEGKLRNYPMGKMSFLRIGGKEYSPVDAWKLRFQSADGHHREGVLRFPRKDASGRDLLGPGTKSMQLVIKNLATKRDRIYKWEFPIHYPKGYAKTSA